MYSVDHRDHVSEIADVPQSDTGAPLPVVFASEHRIVLIYVVSEPDPNWDGTYVNLVDSKTEREKIARIHFDRPYAHMFGPPNDEAFRGHPLAARGVAPYAAWEVHDSSWIRALEQMNSVHPYHSHEMFDELRHFIFAFHDSTFECVAKGYRWEVEKGSVSSVAASFAGSLA